MSKNIIIQEGGVGKAMTADKLKTDLQGGGTCLWVPEDETRLTTKYITKNGTYKASDDGYYGYSQVTVSGIGTAIGIDPTTGEPTIVYPDPETGELDYSIIPSSIAVDTPPTVLSYHDGDSINFNGIVVKGYKQSGDLWTDTDHPDGVIPANELIFPVTTAEASGSPTATSDLYCGIVKPFGFCDSVTATSNTNNRGTKRESHIETTVSGGRIATAYNEGTAMHYICASETQDNVDISQKLIYTSTSPDKPEDTETTWQYIMSETYEHNGKTVHYYSSGIDYKYSSGMNDVSFVSTILMNNLKSYAGEIAWTMVYGDIEGYGTQNIPVQWARPGDAEVLETSFDITVL